MGEGIYTDGSYLEKPPTWHEEDSPWKAGQIAKMIDRNWVIFASYVDIGCGAGRIVHELSLKYPSAVFHGYDVSPKALELAGRFETGRIRMFHQDALWNGEHHYDVAAAIDVVEHVEDYMGFLRRMGQLADYFIFRIPLDVTATSLLRNTFLGTRDTVGRLLLRFLKGISDQGGGPQSASPAGGSAGLFCSDRIFDYGLQPHTCRTAPGLDTISQSSGSA